MSIRIYAQDSKYWMEDLETNVTTEITDIRQDPKGTGDYAVLPSNSANRKFIKVRRIEEGAILDYKETKTFGPKNESTPKAPKIDWTKYLTDEEQKIFDDLKKKCEDRAAKDAQRLRVEALKREYAEAVKKLEEMEG